MKIVLLRHTHATKSESQTFFFDDSQSHKTLFVQSGLLLRFKQCASFRILPASLLSKDIRFKLEPERCWLSEITSDHTVWQFTNRRTETQYHDENKCTASLWLAGNDGQPKPPKLMFLMNNKVCKENSFKAL